MMKQPFLAIKKDGDVSNYLLMITTIVTSGCTQFVVSGSLGTCVWIGPKDVLSRYVCARLQNQNIHESLILCNNYMINDEVVKLDYEGRRVQLLNHIEYLNSIVDCEQMNCGGEQRTP